MDVFLITGTNGSGKGETVSCLIRDHRFRHYSVRSLIEEEITRRGGLTPDRETLIRVANELRLQHGPEYLVLTLYERARAEGAERVVIESVRNPVEIRRVSELSNYFLLGVDAEIRKRFERIQARKSQTDGVTFREFLDQEARESLSISPYEQNLLACRDRAHCLIFNNDTLEDLAWRVNDAVIAARRAGKLR